MVELGKVSILVHTRNRPAFLNRLLNYYDTAPQMRNVAVMVLDASDEPLWTRFQADRGDRRYSFPAEFLHHDPDTPFYDRLATGLQRISTPYVMLAADDDLYFFDWLDEAVALLDSDPSFGTVNGHPMRFRMEGFATHSDQVECYIKPVENPTDRWLEADTIEQRLTDLSDTASDLAITGWYALQRRAQLQTILDHAVRHRLSTAMFEIFLSFAQPALGKTRKVDRVFLARQDDIQARAPHSFRTLQADFEALLTVSRELLVALGMSESAAGDMVGRVYASQTEHMKRADRKRRLRWLADRAPVLRALWSRMRPNYEAPFPPDPRLPTPPHISRCEREVAIVRRAVAPPASRSGMEGEPA